MSSEEALKWRRPEFVKSINKEQCYVGVVVTLSSSYWKSLPFEWRYSNGTVRRRSV
jgi:hypothetical protein